MSEEYENYVERDAKISVEFTASKKWVFKVSIPFNPEDDENPVLDRIRKIYDKLENTYKNG